MGLFSNKKKEVGLTESVAPVAAPAHVSIRDLSGVLRHARITEKASMQQTASIYTFDISARATKHDVMQAVRALYKVNPVKVAVVTIPAKVRRSSRTGKSGVKKGGRKAYVYLKKGETITIS